MSPVSKHRLKRAVWPVAKGGVFGLLMYYFGTPIAEAVASKIAGVPPQQINVEAITREAVSVADEHARSLVASEIKPLQGEIKELSWQVARMAGALEEQNRRRAAP